MSLPFLPGNSFSSNAGKTRFHKSQGFEFKDDLPLFLGDTKPGIGGKLLPGQARKKNCSVFPKGVGGDKPAWVAFDRQVLRFFAYFQEAVQEKREEQFRVRHCSIYFYLVDDTVQVNEPQQLNSGIPQGTLIRRHRIPLPAPDDDRYYTVEDFNVGQEISLYSRVFRIVDCDQFTRNFLQKLGVKVPSPQRMPSDPYSQHRAQMTAAMQPLRPYERQDTLQQFLEYDRRVLRFYGQWDDSDCMFGDVRWMELHYYLSDDTVEVVEKILPNSGRDAVPVFLHRAKLPREPLPLAQPGVVAKKTVLNVFGTGHGGRYILDSLKTGAPASEFYTDADLVVGGVVNLWGRKLILCDCDKFTREYYHSKYGIESFPVEQTEESVPPPVSREIAPYTGFGSEEDSRESCVHLIPKAPRKDFQKFMVKDRQGLESHVLRFVARMDTSRPIDQDRQFVVLFFLADDTISVFEPPQKNSGIVGGKFMERGRIVKSQGSRQEGHGPQYYQPQDMWVGKGVELNSYHFLLTDADEYTLRYMESHPQQFPQGDREGVLGKLRGPASAHLSSLRSQFQDLDKSGSGRMELDQFTRLVKGLSRGLLSDHEALTLGRAFGQRSYPLLPSLMTVVHRDLHKHNFTDFSSLETALARSCEDGTAFIDPGQLRRVCLFVDLPLSQQLVDGTLMNCQCSSTGAVDYRQFLQLINWRDHPLPAPQPQAVPAGWAGSWTDRKGQTQTISSVDYNAFLSALESPPHH